MKTKLVVALAVLLMLGEWIFLRRTTPPVGASATTNSPSTPAPPHLSPRLLRQSTAPPMDDAPSSNALARIAQMWGTNDEELSLTSAQVEPYLQANKRNAESLLAALFATGDHAYLREAKERFPNNPHVALAAMSKSDSPEERREWLEKLKQSAPDNALGSYLSAADYFNTGQTNLAMRELMTVGAKAKLDDYARDAVLNMEEAWKSAGYSEIEAAYAAWNNVQLPALSRYKQIGSGLTNLMASYRQAGDEASAQASMRIGMTLVQRLDDQSVSGTFIQTLVGMAVERMMLNNMDPASTYDNSGRTVQNRTDEMMRQRAANRQLFQQSEQLLPTLQEDELANYFNRRKVSGEVDAMRWLVEKHGSMQQR